MALPIAPTTIIKNEKDVNNFWNYKELVESGKVKKEELTLKAIDVYNKINE
jgi:hypothetical protein